MNHQPNITPYHLTQGKCKPCEGGVDPLTAEEVKPYLTAVPAWHQESVSGVNCIVREFTKKNFVDAVQFIQKIAEVAEAEGHHPDIHLTDYKQLRVELTTHAIGGLSVNDFILAAKIDTLET